MRLSRIILPVVFVAYCHTSPAGGADWPMWRHDVRRSACTTSELPDDLYLQWSRQLPPPQPAWPNESRLHFDLSYEPVALADSLFVGSPNDGSVASYAMDTGKENWRFYTDGPVRLAPAAWQGKVYFGSDDGCLYCVEADSGVEIWRIRGAPDDRGRHRHLGNSRLVSFWPVRGGPALVDGVVYFAAGIWPSMGVFVHAVDANTGLRIWTNSTSHQIQDVRIDHNYLHESGISPQGHLLVVEDLLLVPNGRSMPARFDRRTGKRLHYVQGYRNGDSRVSATGDIALVGNAGVLNLADGREIGSRWASAGKAAPPAWDGKKKDLFEGPMFPYKFLPGCTYRAALCEGAAYGTHQGTVYAYSIAEASTSLYEKEDQGNVLKPARWDAPLLWKLSTGNKAGSPHSMTIKAGRRLYTYVDSHLLAVNLPEDQDGSASIAWKKQLEGRPSSLLAAAGKLIVVTAEGQIHCYGAERTAPCRHPLAEDPPDVRKDAWSESTAALLQTARVKEGYALVLGLRNPRLVEELLRQTEMHVIVVDADSKAIDDLRRRLAGVGADRRRFQAVVDDPKHAALPPCLANLILVDQTVVSPPDASEAIRRLYRVLRPLGGVAQVAVADEQQATVVKQARAARLPNLEAQITGGLVCLRRTQALPGAARWTHETGDSARTFFSQDELVKAPLGVLWYGDGPGHGFHKRKDYGHGVKPQVAGGRLFALQVATDTLHAVDVYTGRLLWTRKLGPSPRYASFSDGVYVASGGQCEVLDPASGTPRDTFAVEVDPPAETPLSVSDIRVDHEVILLALRFNAENAISKGRWNSTLLVALDRNRGKRLWIRPATRRFNTAAIAMAEGQVFCVDSHSPIEIAAMRRRGEPVGKLPSTVLALDSRTGQVNWQVVHDDPPANLSSLHFMGLRAQDDWLAYSSDTGLLLTGKAEATYALNATDGRPVWRKAMRGNQPLIVGPDTFINQAGHTYHIRTGDLVDGRPLFRRGGCNYAVGGKHLLFLRAHCAAYVDRQTRTQYNLRNLRSGCSNSLVAAAGVLSAPCFSVGCVCNYPIQTSFAMVHMPEVLTWSER